MSCFPMLSHRRASTAHQIRRQERCSFPIPHRTSCLPARMLGPGLMLAASCRPARSLGLGLTLARMANSPLIRPNKSQLPSSANAGPQPYAGLNQTKHRCSNIFPPSEETPSTGRVLFFPVKEIPDGPPNVMPRVRVPKTERIRRPQQCKSIKGFIASPS